GRACRWRGPVCGVVDGRAGGRIREGHRLRRVVGSCHRREGGRGGDERVLGRGHRAVRVAGGHGNRLNGLRRRHLDRPGVLGRACRWRGPVGGVVDGRAGGRIREGHRRGGGVGSRRGREGGRGDGNWGNRHRRRFARGAVVG